MRAWSLYYNKLSLLKGEREKGKIPASHAKKGKAQLHTPLFLFPFPPLPLSFFFWITCKILLLLLLLFLLLAIDYVCRRDFIVHLKSKFHKTHGCEKVIAVIVMGKQGYVLANNIVLDPLLTSSTAG